jgi:hypothetical protein
MGWVEGIFADPTPQLHQKARSSLLHKQHRTHGQAQLNLQPMQTAADAILATACSSSWEAADGLGCRQRCIHLAAPPLSRLLAARLHQQHTTS